MGSTLSHLKNPKLPFPTQYMFSLFAYKNQLVIGISFSLSQSDPIKWRPLYLVTLIKIITQVNQIINISNLICKSQMHSRFQVNSFEGVHRTWGCEKIQAGHLFSCFIAFLRQNFQSLLRGHMGYMRCHPSSPLVCITASTADQLREIFKVQLFCFLWVVNKNFEFKGASKD